MFQIAHFCCLLGSYLGCCTWCEDAHDMRSHAACASSHKHSALDMPHMQRLQVDIVSSHAAAQDTFDVTHPLLKMICERPNFVRDLLVGGSVKNCLACSFSFDLIASLYL